MKKLPFFKLKNPIVVGGAATVVTLLVVFSTFLGNVNTNDVSFAGRLNCESATQPIEAISKCLNTYLTRIGDKKTTQVVKNQLIGQIRPLAVKRKQLILNGIGQKGIASNSNLTLADKVTQLAGVLPPDLNDVLEHRVSLTGRLAVNHADTKTGTSTTSYSIETRNATTGQKEGYTLILNRDDPKFASAHGATITVTKGKALGNTLFVSSGQYKFAATTVTPTNPSAGLALQKITTAAGAYDKWVNSTVQPLPAGAKKTLVLKFQYSDKGYDSYANSEVTNLFFNEQNPTSVTNFIKDSSLGKHWLDPNAVIYPQTNMVAYGIAKASPQSFYDCQDGFSNFTYGLPYMTLEAFRKSPDMAQYNNDFAGFWQVWLAQFSNLIILGPETNCPALGGPVGGSNRAAIPDSPATASYIGKQPLFTLYHEVSHNLGLDHAADTQYNECGAQYPDCAWVYEYGDLFDVMGSFLQQRSPETHNFAFTYNGPHKYILGLYNESTQVKSITGPGVYKVILYPNEMAAAPGTQIIRVLRPNGKNSDGSIPATPYYYYISLRRPIGFDGKTLPSTVNPADLDIFDGLSIHNWQGSLNPYYNPKDIQTRMIDGTPQISATLGYYDRLKSTHPQGQMYDDPRSNIQIRLDSPARTATGSLCNPVKVTVCVGQPSCPPNTDPEPSATCGGGGPIPPAPTTPPVLPTTPPPQPTAPPGNQPPRILQTSSSFAQNAGDASTGNQMTQTLVSPDGTKIYIRKYSGGWQGWVKYLLKDDGTTNSDGTKPPNLNFELETSIKSYSRAINPAGRIKEDLLSRDGSKIYSRFYNTDTSSWGPWTEVAPFVTKNLGIVVNGVAVDSTYISAFGQTRRPNDGSATAGAPKQDALVGSTVYSRVYSGGWGAWSPTTLAQLDVYPAGGWRDKNCTKMNLTSAASFNQGNDPFGNNKQDIMPGDGTKVYSRKFISDKTVVEAGWQCWVVTTIPSLNIIE